VQAQNLTHNLSYGVLLGPDLSRATVKYPTYQVNNSLTGVGFDLEVFTELPVYLEKERRIDFRPEYIGINFLKAKL
jgi:hypothetical protein